jgi:hypothetical protein
MRRWSSAHAGAALVRSGSVHREKRKAKSAPSSRSNSKKCLQVQKRRRCLQDSKSVGTLSVGGVHACPESSALGAVVALVNLCCEAHLLSRHAHSHHLRVLTASSPLSFDIVTCATRARKKTPEANTLRHSSCSRCCARARCVGRSDLTCTHIAHPSSRCACSPCPSMF